jgi:hypothetical protein
LGTCGSRRIGSGTRRPRRHHAVNACQQQRPVARLALHQQPQRLDHIGHKARAAGKGRIRRPRLPPRARAAAGKVRLGQLLQMRAGTQAQRLRPAGQPHGQFNRQIHGQLRALIAFAGHHSLPKGTRAPIHGTGQGAGR